MKRVAYLLTIATIALFFTSAGYAQTITGSVRGTVTDPGGAVVPNVQVTATNIDTGITSSTSTNGEGLYSIRLLPVGHYTLTAQTQGFAKYRSNAFSLDIDQEATVDIKLGLESANASVQVEATVAPLLNQENPTLATVIDPATLSSVPMDGRNFMAATVAVPGSVHSSGSTTEQPSINGNRQEGNAMFLDGMDIYDNIDNTGAKYTPSPDAIEQVNVITSNPPAEYDNANGGIIVAVLKSGTNHFHGNAFFQLESHNMAANTWSNKNVASGTPSNISPFTQSYFGGSVGGPIMKDKLFFFADYQGYRYHYAGTSSYSLVPQAFLKGDFSLLLQPTLLGGVANKQITQLYDSQNGFKPFVNNQVPVKSPIAQFLAANSSFYPAPNRTPTDGIAQNDYQGPTTNFNRANQGDVKVDWKLRSTDSFNARYTRYNQQNGSTALLDIEFPNAPSQNDYTSIVLNEVHQFSTAAVNDLRIGFGRAIAGGNTPTDSSGQFGLSGNQKVGIPIQQAYPGFVNQSGFTNISSIGAFSTPELYTENDFLYGDDFSLERGRHLIKIGAEFLRYQQNYTYGGNGGVMGNMTYNGAFTSNPNATVSSPGYSFADFVLGYLDEQDIPGFSSRFGQRQWRDGIYIQDEWKVRDNLTLNLGLRYDYFQPIYERHNKMANVSLVNGSISYAGVNGASRALYNPIYDEFLPRIGFAYTAMPRFVIRGGYAIVDYWEGMGANLRLTQNPPFNNEYITNAIVPTKTSGGTPLSVTAGLPPSTSTAGSTYQAWDPNNRSSQAQDYNLTTEYQLSNKSSFQVGYVGSYTTHMAIPVDATQYTHAPVPGQALPLRFPTLGAVTVKETRTGGMANYNAMQAQYRVRDANGLNFTANYTYGKGMSNGTQGYDGLYGTSGGYYQQDAFNLGAEYGPTPTSATHSLSGSLAYDLPFGRGRKYGTDMNRVADLLVGGWKVAGIASVWTGMPITMGTGGTNYSGAVNSFSARPDHLRPLHVVHRTSHYWFGDLGPTDSATPCAAGVDNGICAYRAQGTTAFGTAANGSERGPGFNNIDLSVYKSFDITENQRLDFRADAFNAFNFANYGNPSTNVSNVNSFGQITGTKGNQRIMQLALNYHF